VCTPGRELRLQDFLRVHVWIRIVSIAIELPVWYHPVRAGGICLGQDDVNPIAIEADVWLCALRVSDGRKPQDVLVERRRPANVGDAKDAA
jgi:hypothetical protein